MLDIKHLKKKYNYNHTLVDLEVAKILRKIADELENKSSEYSAMDFKYEKEDFIGITTCEVVISPPWPG